MRDEPSAVALLEAARRVLRDELIPRLPDECRFAALMVANAMAIAARQHDFGDAPEAAELAGLMALRSEGEVEEPAEGPVEGSVSGGDTSAGTSADTHAELLRLYGELSHDIRHGAYDPGTAQHAALRDHLWRVTLQKLRESNPKALEEAGET